VAAETTTGFPKVTTTAPPGPDGPLVRGQAHGAGSAGFVDLFGERHLKFDHSVGASLETLHINKAFATEPAFEAALRARVDELRQVQHPSLATVHGVERRDGDELCLVSKLTSGRRVSELVPKAHGAAFALELLRLVTPALAMLHRAGEGIAHGAIAAERIVVARDGRLVVADHVFGSALQALKLSRGELIGHGLVVPAGAEPVRLDGRSDMSQLGFVALSLLLGRQLDPADYPSRIPALLDEFARSGGAPMLSAKLRSWLERAMQISPRSFPSAREAQEALGDLPDETDVRMAESVAAPIKPPMKSAPASSSVATAPTPVVHREPVAARPVDPAPGASPAPITFESYNAEPEPSSRGRSSWMMAALAVLAGVEGVVIGALLYARPSIDARTTTPPVTQAANGPVSAAPQALATTPSPMPAASPLPDPAESAARPEIPLASASSTSIASTAAGAAPAAAAASRFGGVRVAAAIPLQVFKDGLQVGSSAGPIAVSEGTHNLEFVNEELGFRIHQTVNVKSGQMTAVNIGLPNGRVSINAVPWAEVFIDGNAAGETPIANLSLPIGTHEIVFRHPQLGEKKQTVVVKAEGLLRVTQTLGPGLF